MRAGERREPPARATPAAVLPAPLSREGLGEGGAEPCIPIIQKAFAFNVALYGYVNRFPRAHKALLGRELLRLALDLVVLSDG